MNTTMQEKSHQVQIANQQDVSVWDKSTKMNKETVYYNWILFDM